jgi:transcription termination/antitermination protein NusA
MKGEFYAAIAQIASERSLAKDVILESVEAALISAYKRMTGSDQSVTVRIDPASGQAHVFAQKMVVEQVEDPRAEISLADARALEPGAQLGDTVQVETTPANFGRIAAQTAKQVVMQRIREAERDRFFSEYIDRVGDIVNVMVQRVDPRSVDPARPEQPGAIIVEIGKAEAVLPPNEQVKTERYRVGQRMRVLLLDVQRNQRGPQLIVSRAHKNMLRRLLELEVPEIHNGTVEIKAIARESGMRSKVAVAARQEGLDPVGACVGMRGIRIQNIVNELYGEKIDIVSWHPDMAVFIANALSPAQVVSVELLEQEKTAQVIVPERQLSLAIGKEGQNARLAAKLTGWRIDIKSATASMHEPEEDFARRAVEALRAEAGNGFDSLAAFPDAAPEAPRDDRRKVRANNTVVYQNRVFGPLPENLVGETVRLRLTDAGLQVQTPTRIVATYPWEQARALDAAEARPEDDMEPADMTPPEPPATEITES